MELFSVAKTSKCRQLNMIRLNIFSKSLWQLCLLKDEVIKRTAVNFLTATIVFAEHNRRGCGNPEAGWLYVWFAYGRLFAPPFSPLLSPQQGSCCLRWSPSCAEMRPASSGAACTLVLSWWRGIDLPMVNWGFNCK